MNKVAEYIDALSLTTAEKAALPARDIRTLHEALDPDHRNYVREDDSPLGSVKVRLEQSWPDSLVNRQLTEDAEARTQLETMPKATRSPLSSDPWRPNPI